MGSIGWLLTSWANEGVPYPDGAFGASFAGRMDRRRTGECSTTYSKEETEHG
jgi:hypothetical protein